MTTAPDLQELPDPAIALTLSYLDLLERHLKIIFNAQGEPVCIHEKITPEDVEALKLDLRGLLAGESATRAIESSKIYGRDHIQSIGFGHADSLDTMVKLGLLCSERVVLWDILSGRILIPSKHSNFSVDVLVEVACNLLLLRPIVKLGGLVVLPHPVTWSSLAQKIERELIQQGTQSSRSTGWSIAFAAIEEGIPLHPYTLFKNNESVPDSPSGAAVIVSIQNASYQAAVSSLLREPDFQFLADISAVSFFKISKKHPDLHRTLRKHFLSLSGLTIQQRNQEYSALMQELLAAIKKRDKAVFDYAVDGSIATAGLVAGALTLASSIAGATVMAGLGLAPSVISVLRRWINRPDRPVVVQAFQELKASEQPAAEAFAAIPSLTQDEIAADIAGHIDNLMEMQWTEQRHNYISELDEDISRRVTEALLPEQILILVNYRTFQEDYIGDYLEYLWDVSELAFWRHIEQTFLSTDGMLMYDGFNMHNILKSYDMPISVWICLLRSIPTTYAAPLLTGTPLSYKGEANQATAELQVKLLLEVLSFQLSEASDRGSKQRAFHFWLVSIKAENGEVIGRLLAGLFPDGEPEWVVKLNLPQSSEA